MTKRKMTIESLATASQRQFLALDKKIDGLRDDVKEGLRVVLEEIKGLRDDAKIARQASRVDYAGVMERVEELEADMKKVKEKVNVR